MSTASDENGRTASTAPTSTATIPRISRSPCDARR